MEFKKHHRSYNAIRHVGQRLTEGTRDFWTVEEDNILKQFYPIEGNDSFKRLPTRNLSQCKNRVHTLNLKLANRTWSEFENNILYTYYPKLGSDYCYKKINELGRSISRGTLLSHVRNMGLKFNGRGIIRIEDNKYFILAEFCKSNSCTPGTILYYIKTGKADPNGYHWRYVEEKDCE